VPVVMIVIASAAADFGRFAAHQRNDGVVGDAAAFDAVVINDVSKAIVRHGGAGYG
jgi:hypothetical protein